MGVSRTPRPDVILDRYGVPVNATPEAVIA